MKDIAKRGDMALDALFKYTKEKYEYAVLDCYDECPYDTDLDDEDQAYREAFVWFMCERKNAAGRTVLDEFVDKFVDDREVRKMLLRMKEPIRGTFKITGALDASNRIRAVHKSSGRVFFIEMFKTHWVCRPGYEFTGRIHPWYDDGTHRTNSVLTFRVSEDSAEIMRHYSDLKKLHRDMFDAPLEKIESTIVAPELTVEDLLKKFPAGLANTICDALFLDRSGVKAEKILRIARTLVPKESLDRIVSGLSVDEQAVLRLVLEKGGAARYGDLCRRMGGDDFNLGHIQGWYKKSPARRWPASPIALLRCKGLLVVGMQKIGGRKYKVAVIPADVAANIRL